MIILARRCFTLACYREKAGGRIMDLICMGEMLIDFTPGKEPDSYTANPGGAVANVAVSAARNHIDTAFLGVLGNDDFGRRLKGILDTEGVEMLCPKLTDEAVTTLAFVTLYEGGERSFTFVRKPGADILLSREDVREKDIDACRMLHAGSVSLSDEPSRSAVAYAMELAHKKGKLVSFDVNYREMIWHDKERCRQEVEKLLGYVDFLKISDEELYFAGGEENIPSFMEQHGITVLIETCGSAGAKYYFRGVSGQIAGKKVKAVDATGAGDAFWGGFLSNLLHSGITQASEITEEIICEALRYGNTSGALCVQKMGGIPALPTKEEIEAAL
jgi:sugar/nucleoside kinase (ribokinase family)